MASTQAGCFQSFQVCGMRVGRLDATGAPSTGADNRYLAKAPIDVTLTPQYQNGVELTVENGCGSLCGYYKSPDLLKSYDIKFALCDLDIELINILTSGDTTLVNPTTTANIGFELPAVTSTTGNYAPNGVSLEMWSKRWHGSSTPASPAKQWWRWSFPRAFLHIGEVKLGNQFLQVPIEGFLQESPNWHKGPWGDYPGASLGAIGAVTEDTANLGGQNGGAAQCGWI